MENKSPEAILTLRRVRDNYPEILDWLSAKDTAADLHDLHWLCDEIEAIGVKDPDTMSCRDNFRLCLLGESDKPSESYEYAANQGCCGSYDEIHVNPSTGHRFMIGFNYGH
jgi:hypothetical protein